MSEARTLLIADPDAAAARRLGEALRGRGHRVIVVRDGSKALEVAVMQVPDLVIYDVACPLLDARTFARILRANPRTASVPLVLVGAEDTAGLARGSQREAWLQKPFNLDEVQARIEQILHRAGARTPQAARALRGSLGEVGLPDLLQVLAANRRSGTLSLVAMDEEGAPVGEGEIVLEDGRPVDALGEVTGLKALFRFLGWQRGSFVFQPGTPAGPQRIRMGVDELLLEGLRQLDEARVLARRLPPRTARLESAVDLSRIPDDLEMVALEVLGLLELFQTVGEVVDNARATDLEVLTALATLLDRGLVRVAPPGGRRRGPLVAPDVAYALHRWHAARRPGPARLRVVVAAADAPALRRLLEGFAGVEGWRPGTAPEAVQHRLGVVGAIHVTEFLEVLLVALPGEDAAAPLWELFGRSAVGALLGGPEEAPALAPLATHLRAGGRRIVPAGEHPADALAALLGALAAG